MVEVRVSFLLLQISIFYLYSQVDSATTRLSRASAFIKISCQSTQYPQRCVESLSRYAHLVQQDPEILAHIALTLSMSRARYIRVYMSKTATNLKGKEYQAVRDCLDRISDSVAHLSQSIEELSHLGKDGGDDFMWHVSNVETWVSSALTDQYTCVNGFTSQPLQSKLRANIQDMVVNVAEVTSNALALVDRYIARVRAARATKKP